MNQFRINESFASFCSEQGTDENQQRLNAKQNVTIHKVTADDTLEGLSLQYGISVNRIREFNGLTSDSIYYLKEIRIPDPQSNLERQESGDDTMKTMKKYYMQNYILEGDDKCLKIATYYLDSNGWDLEAAAKEYQSDLKAEKSSKQREKDQRPLLKGSKVKQE